MSKEQIEHIENLIRVAAEKSMPVIDGAAWVNMEAKLNKEKRRKKPVIFWWTLVLLAGFLGGAGLYFYLNTEMVKDKNVLFEKDKKTEQSKFNNQINIPQKNVNAGNKAIFEKSKSRDKFNKHNTGQPREKILYYKTNNESISIKSKFAKSLVVKSTPIKKTIKNLNGAIEDLVFKEPADLSEANILKELNITLTGNNQIDKIIPVKKTVINNIFESKKKFLIVGDKEIEISKTNVNKTADRSSNSIKSKFYLLASMGGDVAGVAPFSFKNNPISLKYGFEIGYDIGKKIALETGFYLNQKKYIAGPGDYVPKAGSYWNMVQIIKIDASCLVYEIPFALRFKLLQQSSFNLFATAGLSSFIMKKEDYNYYYNSSSGYHEAAAAYIGNKNFLSMLTIGAGIEKNISSAISIIVQSGLSIPVAGVGEGRVKLFSTDLQLGIKYHPFKKSIKK